MIASQATNKRMEVLAANGANDYIASANPFFKWAGGKRQLLPQLRKLAPEAFGKYLEPFLGGGALFFDMAPEKAVLSDLNGNLIDTYIAVRDAVEDVIRALSLYRNDEEEFYRVRSLDPSTLSPVQRAAREIYLNKTCFNGLYRVNKQGEFNVPFGKRSNPTICDAVGLRAASAALQTATLITGSYRDVLRRLAAPNDFVFLDPPYHPSGEFADFNRFTKESFHEHDQVEVKEEFGRLVELGCLVVLTNSNTPFVRDLYKDFDYQVISTRRNINARPGGRNGEDLIVVATSPRKRTSRSIRTSNHLPPLAEFPGTRFMGSKHRILPFLQAVLSDLSFSTVLDAFSGSGCVSYMFKQLGAEVISNDFMHFAHHISNATVANSQERLTHDEVELLMARSSDAGTFIRDTFTGLYFTEEENIFLDNLLSNIDRLLNPYKRSLAIAAISRACLKRRPRGVFTYVGTKYLDGRSDLRIDLPAHFQLNVDAFNHAVFDNGRKSLSVNQDVLDLNVDADLVYLDPPYVTPHSDNEYVRRYHFIEGFARKWQGVDIQANTKTKKFKNYPTPFSKRSTAYDAFETLFEKFRASTLVVSYSSNSLPTKSELVTLLKKFKNDVTVHQVDHTYSFGTHSHLLNNGSSRVREFLFVAR